MQGKPPKVIRLYKKVHRIYIILDKPANSCIMDYNWSSVEMEWIFDKIVYNTWDTTYLGNSLRDGKYLLGII